MLLQCKVKCSSLFDCGLSPNLSAMPMNDALHRGETNPGPWKFRHPMESLECSEKFGGIGRVEACAIITDEIDIGTVDRCFAKRNVRGGVLGSKFPGVAE